MGRMMELQNGVYEITKEISEAKEKQDAHN